MARNWEYAAKIFWPKLVEAAEHRTTLFYEDLAPLFDTNPLSVGKGLGPILFYCLDAGLPPLTVLVIGKTTNVPGPGFIAWDIDNLEEAYRQVYAYNWQSLENPFEGFGPDDSTKGFAEKVIKKPGKAGEVYAKVKVRGLAQKIFRLALLEAYDYQCAFCLCSFEEALDAAHIIPWNECQKELRISPRNGVLLCANHHRLIDAGWLSISEDFTIEFNDDGTDIEDYSETDMYTFVNLDGEPMLIPEREELRPDPALLAIRFANE